MSGRRVELTQILRDIAAVAKDLPPGARVTVSWSEAPPDLVLVVSMQPGGRIISYRFGSGAEILRAEWNCDGVFVHAERKSHGRGRARTFLRLVK